MSKNFAKSSFRSVCLFTAAASLITMNSTAQAANLEVEYQFDGDLLDSSGNSRDGALGSPTFVTGVDGQALQFDGTGPAMTTGQSASALGISGANSKSVTAWVNTQAFNGGGFSTIGPNANGQQFGLRTVSANTWRAQFFGAAFDFDFTSVPTNKNWAHMALVYDGTEARAYVNGQLAGSKTVALNTDNPAASSLQLGNWFTSNYNGAVDQFRLYSGTALTASEIKSQFQSREHRAALLDQQVNVGAQHDKTSYISDDFNSGTLNPLLFSTELEPIPGSSSVGIVDGEVEITGRGHLNTTGQFNPSANGLEITGRWSPTNPVDTDFFQVLTRSNGLPSGSFGETGSGVEFFKGTGSGTLNVVSKDGSFTISDIVQTGSINFFEDGIYDFRITDIGGSVTFQMTQVGDPSNTASLTANVSGDTNTDFVTFHNREGTGRAAQLDNLRISSLTPTISVDTDGFQVRQVDATGLTIDSIADAEALLALNPGDSGHNGEASEARSVINYLDAGGNGNYGGDNPFALGGGLNDFAVLGTATLLVPADETWTFAVNIDDGARLRIDGVDVIVADRTGATADFFGTTTLDAGFHDLELLFFERAGGAAVELFYARGTHNVFDPVAFSLLTIGTQAVPEPETYALGLIGLLGVALVARRQRRARRAAA